MNTPLAITEWLVELEGAMLEVATAALGFPDAEIIEKGLKVTDNLGGAYLSLTGDIDTVQIGVTTDPEGFQRIAKALLGMEPTDEDLTAPDMADAVCEVVNVLAGIIKRRIQGKLSRLALGLPIFVRGGVQTTDRMSIIASKFRFGDILASIVIIQPAVPRHESLPPRARSVPAGA